MHCSLSHLFLDAIARADSLEILLLLIPFRLVVFLLLWLWWWLLLLLWCWWLLLLLLLLLHPLKLLLDTCWRLDGHHVLDLVGLNLTPCLLDLDGQLQFDLLGNGASLLLCLCLDLGLNLGCYVGWQGRE